MIRLDQEVNIREQVARHRARWSEGPTHSMHATKALFRHWLHGDLVIFLRIYIDGSSLLALYEISGHLTP
jgi:hypothetical protein